MTQDQRTEIIENQLDHIYALCESYVEGDQLEDVGNIRALYEEYAEWIELQNDGEGCYEVMWAPDFTEV